MEMTEIQDQLVKKAHKEKTVQLGHGDFQLEKRTSY